MATPKRRKTLAEQIADLDDAAPKGQYSPIWIRSKLTVCADFDPEDVDLYRSGDESSNSGDERDDVGTEHYEAVE
jgi:hypothetical protein